MNCFVVFAVCVAQNVDTSPGRDPGDNHADDEVRPCTSHVLIPLCPGADASTIANESGSGDDDGYRIAPEAVCHIGGDAEGYCRVGYSGDYIKTLG